MSIVQALLYRVSLRIVRSLFTEHFSHLSIRRGIGLVESWLMPALSGEVLRTVALSHCSGSWFAPPEAKAGRVILYLHGGGFMVEAPRLHGNMLVGLCRATGSHGFMPHYRLAPECPYPAATDDCFDAYRYLLEQGYPATSIVIVGDSAGGNLSLVTLLRIRAAGLALPAGCIALSPLTDASGASDSFRRNAGHDRMFKPAALEAVLSAYLPDRSQRQHPWVSPLNGDLDGLPPVYLLAGSGEMLLDDALRFSLQCPSARLEVWHGMPHVFPLLAFLPEAHEARRRIADTILAMYRGLDPANWDPLRHTP